MNEELRATLEELLRPLQKAVEDLKGENAQLKERLEVRDRNLDLASDFPNHLAPGRNIGGDSRAARSVTIATRPVHDNPNDPLWGEHKVDPGGLVRNSISGGLQGTSEG